MGLNSYLKAYNRMVEANAMADMANQTQAARQAQAAQQGQPPRMPIPQGRPRDPWPPSMPPRRPPSENPAAHYPARGATRWPDPVQDADRNAIPPEQRQPRAPTMPSSAYRDAGPHYPAHPYYPQPAPPPMCPQPAAGVRPAAPQARDIENQNPAVTSLANCMPAIVCVGTFAAVTILSGVAYAVATKITSDY